ncbi:phytanoyl-CoA dioxygenase family protein [Limobrevibacterium gyesilva]|uniref:Phytanoyl-CoA dioxygenase family protein n=1 Tax=Limobrevibacterium gyesilva TaxID=2991712 RepID=A0AA41YS18_9PROT|nr:phytanoyl-CoA dioxygenase family protein [Limobrevibacterium gyesilva]MCW3475538.1 phytanoyl-CoA dioxygenase family protein [Limobrevibacterium gyesilva]
MVPFTESNDIVQDGAALAARMRRDGYLFLRGLLPREDVAAVQRQVGEIVRAAGWLRNDRPVEQAVADPAGFCVDPEPAYLTTLRKINRLQDYHELKHHPALIGVFERMLGGPILPHPRVLMRNIFPAREEITTKAHQDFPNVQGTTEVYTAWIPLIDCPMEVGPLQVAAGTHDDGVYDFHIGAGAGGIEIKDGLEGRWASGAFAVGDVLIFHSMTVHKGVPNRSDRLRMSMDVRFQLVSEPFNPDNANPDGQPLSWEEVYADWRSDELKYYWKRLPLTLKAFDPQWFEKRDALAFELGEAGDPRARSVLQRIVARDADPTKRMRAQHLLDALPPLAPAGSVH